MKKAVVVGGCGFIGSYVCEKLLDEGYFVYCVDNAVTGSWQNVTAVLDNENFKRLDHDISQPLRIDDQIDEVYHLASPASPKDFVSLSVEIMLANARGTEHLLELCKEKGARFLLASTSEVYGDPQVHPQHEDYWGNVNPVGVRSPYDESKRYSEAFTTAFCKRHNMPYAIIRIFNTYGPRMRETDGRVVSNFIPQALRGDTLTIHGDGSQTRSFCFVEDLVKGIVLAMRKSAGIPINLGSDAEVSIKELAEKVITLTSSKSDISYLPLPENDPKLRRPDIRRAKETLHWQPSTPLADGLTRTIEYFR